MNPPTTLIARNWRVVAANGTGDSGLLATRHAAIVIVASATAAWAETPKALRVVDGDTIVVSIDGT